MAVRRLFLVAMLGLAACGTATPSVDAVTEALIASGLPEPVAECAAAAIDDSLSRQELRDLVERGASGAPADDPARTDDSADQVRNALAECRAELDPTGL